MSEIQIKNVKAKGCFTEGLAKHQLGRHKECIEDFDKAISLSQDDELKAIAYYSIGLAKAYLHEYEEAIADFNTAIDLSQDHELKILACGDRAMAKHSMQSMRASNDK